MQSRSIGSGLVFGKFMPLHEGHLHLLYFAQMSCTNLTIIVCSRADEPIPGAIRHQWVKQQFPTCRVVHHDAELPQDPAPDDDGTFWRMWKESLYAFCPDTRFDALFGSEDYGWRMAREMGIEYIPVNRNRDVVPISGTAIRNDPMRYWAYIPKVVRPYFVQRYAVIGPECTGKSTLVRRLSAHFETSFIPEYARGYLQDHREHGGRGLDAAGKVVCTADDIPNIVRGQLATEDALAFNANRAIFCDTDVFTTYWWSITYYGSCPGWILEEGLRRRYRMTFIADPRGIPYVADPLRTMPNLDDRIAMFDDFAARMRQYGRPCEVLTGSWDDRFRQVVAFVGRASGSGS